MHAAAFWSHSRSVRRASCIRRHAVRVLVGGGAIVARLRAGVKTSGVVTGSVCASEVERDAEWETGAAYPSGPQASCPSVWRAAAMLASAFAPQPRRMISRLAWRITRLASAGS